MKFLSKIITISSFLAFFTISVAMEKPLGPQGKFNVRPGHEVTPTNISVVPVTRNPVDGQWLALLGFVAEIVPGMEHFGAYAHERHWAPFDFYVKDLAQKDVVLQIQQKFAHYGLILEGARIQNAVSLALDGRTYYFINVPYEFQNNARVLYDKMQEYNDRLKLLVERSRNNLVKNLDDEVRSHNLNPHDFRFIDFFSTVMDIVDVQWISIQQIIGAPANKTWFGSGTNFYHHTVDPIFKKDLATYWGSILPKLNP